MSCVDSNDLYNWFQLTFDNVHCISKVVWFTPVLGFEVASFEDSGFGIMECTSQYYCDNLILTISTEGSDEISAPEGARCHYGNTVRLALESGSAAGSFDVYEMAVIENPSKFNAGLV